MQIGLPGKSVVVDRMCRWAGVPSLKEAGAGVVGRGISGGGGVGPGVFAGRVWIHRTRETG